MSTQKKLSLLTILMGNYNKTIKTSHTLQQVDFLLQDRSSEESTRQTPYRRVLLEKLNYSAGQEIPVCGT
jgi:hypothetical protein